MKARHIPLALAALVAAAAFAAACGGDSGDGGSVSGIRIQKGLSLAAIPAADSGGESSDQSGLQGAEPAPAAGGGQRLDSARAADGRVGYVPAMPLLQQTNSGVTVQGFGSATADADAANIDFYFGTIPAEKPMPMPEPRGETAPGAEGGSGASSSGGIQVAPAEPVLQEQAEPITEAQLQPVINAITAQGVAREDIELITQPYYDPYYRSATLRVKVSDVSKVDAIVNAATDASAALSSISLQGTNVSYTVSDCAALERAAMKAAVEDAAERAAAFAETLGVGLGSITGASNYSYAPFGGAPCGGDYYGPVPLGGFAYAEGQTPEVQVVANVSVTYAIQ